MSNKSVRDKIDQEVDGLLADPRALRGMLTEIVCDREIKRLRDEIVMLKSIKDISKPVKPRTTRDPRIPPSGTVFYKTISGVEWRITMTDDIGNAVAEASGHAPVSGTLGHIGRTLSGAATVNPYTMFGLNS